ncbi:MAG: AAA family ATPase, partial [Endomicrobia bacterium]|nr:AAA family ATPase [Endomicrobiia bacterium]
CGSKLTLLCSSCDSEVDVNDKFCGFCGTRLIQETDTTSVEIDSSPISFPDIYIGKKEFKPEDVKPSKKQVVSEQRFISVLSADVCGFTSLVEQSDPEKVREELDKLFREISDVIIRYDGLIYKYIGDEILCIFGLPGAHEDDPFRAVLAAQEIQAKLTHNKCIQTTTSEITLKFVITSGVAIVNFSPWKNDYEIHGEVFLELEHLKKLAKPGQILISDKTMKFVEESFEFQPVEGDKKFPTIKCYEVVRKKVVKVFHRRLRAKLVGRDEEIRLLQKIVDRTISGEPFVVGIVGDAGLGKSRLLHELLTTYLHNKDLVILTSRAVQFQQTTAYILWLEILKQVFNITEIDTKESILQKITEKINEFKLDKETLLPCFSSLLGIRDISSPDVVSEEKRKQVFIAIKDLLFSIAEQKPLILVFEDLHWIDPDSYALLTFIIDNLTALPVLILCLYRPYFSHKCSNKANFIQITLKELSREENSEMINSLLGTNVILPSEIKELIIEKSEGNPYYTEEIVKSHIDMGYLELDEKTSTWPVKKDLTGLVVPETIQGIILSRIDRLPQQVKQVLQTCLL